MFKVCLILALAIAGVCAQESAPEPYSYGYETDTHAAAEQRDPSGKVTGYYTLVDNDGRQRRVEYVADEAGFRAKVQTNEVGTKSENSADVEVLAAPPTREQLVYQQAPVVQQQQQQQRVVSQQVVAAAPQRTGVAYNQQQQYGYYPGYGNYNNYNGYNQYGYAAASGPYGYGLYDNGVYGGYNNGQYAGYNNGQYNSYNNHLPSSYYRSVQSVGPVQSAGYGVVGTVGRSASPVVSSTTQTRRTNYQTVGVAPTASYGYQTVGVGPSTGYGYQTVGYAPAAGYGYQASAVPSSVGYSSSNLLGSSNYAVIQKREALDGPKNSPRKPAEKEKKF